MPPLSFFPSELILSCHVESFPSTFLHGSSFWVPRGTSSLFMNCWFLSLLIHFLHNWVADRDISTLVSCVSWSPPPPWTVLIQPWLCCTSRESQAPKNPQVSRSGSYHWAPQRFSNLDELGFLLPFVSWDLRLTHSWVWVHPYDP